jgi:hypothetical protein
MPYLRSWFSVSSSIPNVPSNAQRNRARRMTFFAGFLLASLTCTAQIQPQDNANQQPDSKPDQSSTITIPAGTQLSLVLTQPIQSRYLRRGDDIYAQVTSPVTAENQVAIPAGTFVQGTIDKLERRGGRAELRVQSMAITFPDGYVASISGPATLESTEGYAFTDPGPQRSVWALALPAAGAGVGALIGHSVGASPSTLASSEPPGCVGPPPECISSSVTGPSNQGRNTVIGAGIGAAVGMVASMTLMFGSHHFFIDAGTPVEMTLQHPVTLQQNEVADAVRRSAEQPGYEQPILPRRVFPPADIGPPPGIPGPSATPPTIIPGIPGPDGIPGPPIIIPGPGGAA